MPDEVGEHRRKWWLHGLALCAGFELGANRK
jgi:hypothetical protein